MENKGTERDFMFCRNCGKNLGPNVGKFCDFCGSPMVNINNEATEPKQNSTKVSVDDINKVLQLLLSIVLAIFSLLNAIAVFLPLIEEDKDTVINCLQNNYGLSWLGLIASVLAVVLICICWKSNATGYPVVMVFAVILMVLDIIFVSRWKRELGAESWFGTVEESEGVGLVFYNVGSIAIPICAFLKTMLDVIFAKVKGPANVETHLSHLMNDDLQTDMSRLDEGAAPDDKWKCEKCGRMNHIYVGTCACGKVKPYF